jgi:CBS domain-containing protein
VDFQLNLKLETVEQAIQADPPMLAPSETVRQAFGALKSANHGCVLICSVGGALEGIFTERDALRYMAERADLEQSISSIMTSSPQSVSISDSIGVAIERMAGGGFRRLPVVDDDNKPIGVLNVSGLLHFLVEHFPATIYNLPPNPHHKTTEREGA